MRVFNNIEALPTFKNAVVTIGTFDGVHLGHQKIISQLKAEAAHHNGETIIITFHPHPRKIVKEGNMPVPILTTLSEKIKLLESFGVDNVIVVPFDEAFSNQSAEEYIEKFLWDKCKPSCIIVGYDHRFGHGRTGDYKLLEKYGEKIGFKVKEISEQVQNEVAISSTRIREALLKGDILTANNFLGHPYFFEGMVVTGNQLGRTIGFPTANLDVDNSEKLIPANGVYAVKVKDPHNQNNQLKGMMNIGVRPTVGGTQRTIEVNILDFNQDIYGKMLEIEIIQHLRGEVKFAGLDALKEQLAKDRDAVNEIL